MRILLILIIIIAAFVVIQAHRHSCKYDSTLINCVLGKSRGEAPASGETSQPAPAPETPAPATPAPATPPAEPAPATPPAQ
jgi:hypothetical protein